MVLHKIESGSVRAVTTGIVNVSTVVGIGALNLLPAASESFTQHPNAWAAADLAYMILLVTLGFRGGLNFHKAWKL